MTRANTTIKAPGSRSQKTAKPDGPSRKSTSSLARHPWEKLEEAFIFGVAEENSQDRNFLNLKEIAELFDVPYQRVRERSSKYRWTERRHSEQTKLVMERQKKRNDTLVGQAIAFDESSLQVAKVGMSMVTARLGEIAKEFQTGKARRDAALARRDAGLPVERTELYSAINYREMESLGRAAETFQNIGRKALGTDIEKHEVTGSVEVTAVSITDELLRDDPERLAGVLAATMRAGLFDALTQQQDDDTVDAEYTEEGDEDDSEQATAS